MGCGPCTQCCCYAEVPEINKPVNEWCRYIEAGKGCTIYETRPSSCRSYQCVWLVNPQLPEFLRPDICHVAFESLGKYKIFLALVDIAYPTAWTNPRVLQLIARMQKAGYAVVTSPTPNFFLTNDGRTKEQVWADIKKFTQEVKEQNARFTGVK